MRKLLFGIVFCASLCASTLRAQAPIAGDWQGTLEGPKLRTVLRITPAEHDTLSAMFYSVDQGGMDGIPVTGITLTGSDFKFAIPQIGGSYQGTLSPDGSAITGKWTQGPPLTLNFVRATKETLWLRDDSPHTVSFIPVEPAVKLEVLDWGGTGRPLVFLAGLGNSAHIFDTFAPKLTPKYHVYGITRRGFGASSSPAPEVANYTADRLGDDVLAVIAALKLDKPVLAGHSIAGEELSSVGTRHPEKVSGLIYLDATFAYAFYDRARGDFMIDSLDLRKKLDQLLPDGSSRDTKPLIQELQATTLPRFEKDLADQLKRMAFMPPPPPSSSADQPHPNPSSAILAGQQKYAGLHGPILAICAVPHDMGGFPGDATARAAAEAGDLELTTAQCNAFAAGVPSAHVVRLPHANHYVFKSNEADVLREINTFMASLP